MSARVYDAFLRISAQILLTCFHSIRSVEGLQTCKSAKLIRLLNPTLQIEGAVSPLVIDTLYPNALSVCLVCYSGKLQYEHFRKTREWTSFEYTFLLPHEIKEIEKDPEKQLPNRFIALFDYDIAVNMHNRLISYMIENDFDVNNHAHCLECSKSMSISNPFVTANIYFYGVVCSITDCRCP